MKLLDKNQDSTAEQAWSFVDSSKEEKIKIYLKLDSCTLKKNTICFNDKVKCYRHNLKCNVIA